MSDPAAEASASRSHDCAPCPGRPVLERIETRAKEIGDGFTIRRALPSARRRMVGAWCFLDHAGPIAVVAGGGLRVGPHPHIGLQTFTWMIEGTVIHRDSLGNEQRISAGEVNLMTAGRGIAHAEDSDPTARSPLHLVQLWIALPEAQRHCAPAFRNYPQLPLIELGGFRVQLLAGDALGKASPAEVHSPLVGMDLTATGPASVALPLSASFEHAALVLSGAAQIAGETLAPGTLLYLGSDRDRLELNCPGAARILLLGGTPFGEEILLWWNFVARQPEEIEQATHDWNDGRRFGVVTGSPSSRLLAPALTGLRLHAPNP